MNTRFIWHIIYCLVILLNISDLIAQNFRLVRPIPDHLESNGNYLYGEPAFWTENWAHRGLDMWVINDTVYSASDGIVEFAAYDPDNEDGYEPGGFGNYLRIRSVWNNKNIYIYYAHLTMPLVNSGNTLYPGQPIAISGNTGNSTGPHLHFELWYNGTPVNPNEFIAF